MHNLPQEGHTLRFATFSRLKAPCRSCPHLGRGLLKASVLGGGKLGATLNLSSARRWSPGNWMLYLRPSDPSCLPRPAPWPGKLNSRSLAGGRCWQETEQRREGGDPHFSHLYPASLPGCLVGLQLIRRFLLLEPRLWGSGPDAPCPPFALENLEMAKASLCSLLNLNFSSGPWGFVICVLLTQTIVSGVTHSGKFLPSTC